MRDKIKKIMKDWHKTGTLPSTCTFCDFSGGFTITDTEDPWSNWKVEGSSVPGYDKVSYCVYNKYSPADINEKGILCLE